MQTKSTLLSRYKTPCFSDSLAIIIDSSNGTSVSFGPWISSVGG